MERVWTAFLLMFLGASAFAWIVALLHEWDVRPLRRLVAVLRHQAWEACLIAAVTVGFVHHGATKGTNGMDRGDSPVAEGGLSVEGGGMVESDGLRGGQSLSEVPCAAYGGTNDYSTVTDFRITEMHTATNGGMISAAWPTNWSLPLSSLLLYARGDLSTGCWANVASATVPDGCSAVDIGVPCEILPDGGTDRAFLALGTGLRTTVRSAALWWNRITPRSCTDGSRQTLPKPSFPIRIAASQSRCRIQCHC